MNWVTPSWMILGMILGLGAAFNLEKITDFVEKLFGFKILSSDVYYIDKLPSQVNPLDVTLIVLTAILISLLATALPLLEGLKARPC